MAALRGAKCAPQPDAKRSRAPLALPCMPCRAPAGSLRSRVRALTHRCWCDILLQEFRRLAGAMVEGKASAPGPRPPNLVSRQWSLLPPVIIDSTPFGKSGKRRHGLGSSPPCIPGGLQNIINRSLCSGVDSALRQYLAPANPTHCRLLGTTDALRWVPTLKCCCKLCHVGNCMTQLPCCNNVPAQPELVSANAAKGMLAPALSPASTVQAALLARWWRTQTRAPGAPIKRLRPPSRAPRRATAWASAAPS